MKMEPIDVDVKDTRIFQHLVLLFDRPDFLKDCLLARTRLLLSPPGDKTLVDKYSEVPAGASTEAKRLREKYRYPRELERAIGTAILRNKVTGKDVLFYKPETSPQKQPLAGYSHPILGIRLEARTIRRDRELYWLNKKRYGRKKNGYRKIKKKVGGPLTTIQTAIKSYKRKLSVKINS